MAQEQVDKTDTKKELLKLIQDISCLEKLNAWTEKVNIFQVLKIARAEIRHSNMLAWLLDPNENHGLGSRFLRAFITDLSVSHSYEYADDVYDAIVSPEKALDLLMADLTDSRVFREWNNIDVVIMLPKDYVIAIENKVDAAEGKANGRSQLEKYQEILTNHGFQDNKIIKIFLSPNARKPSSSNDDWKVYTYKDVLSVLENVNNSQHKFGSNEVNVLIGNYIDILKNEIMGNDELRNLCNEIYRKHKTAFDLIYQNIDSVTSMASTICQSELRRLEQNSGEGNNVILDLPKEKSGVNLKFTTKGSVELQNKLDSIEAYYGLEFRPHSDNGVKAKLVLVLHNVAKTYDKSIAKIVNDLKEKEKKKKARKIDGDWEWTGIWSRERKFEELVDENLVSWVRETYNAFKEYDKELIKLSVDYSVQTEK